MRVKEMIAGEGGQGFGGILDSIGENGADEIWGE